MFTGEVVALMGPSGSGKTTLLNLLARRAASSGATESGVLTVDDEVVSIATFRNLASFVEQEDALTGSLTARETIEIAAHLSRPRSVTRLSLSRYCLRLIILQVVKGTALCAHQVPPNCFWSRLLCRYVDRHAYPERDQWWSETSCERGQPARDWSEDTVSR